MKNNTKKKSNREEYEEDEVSEVIGSVTSAPIHLVGSPAWFDFVTNVMSAKSDIDVEALTAEFPEDCVRHRKGDFGKSLNYIPAKFVRERLNDVLGCKWSFFPMMEQRVVDPIPTYDRKNDEERPSPKYIKILGVLVIPGLGVQVQYGVKKTLGFNESDDWKAATTDAFKKCCAAFGIEADYEIEDMEGEDDNSAEDLDLDDIEYDDDSLAEALDTEVNFGKYKDFTMEEILDEDPEYLEWLAEKAREKDVRMAAMIVLKHSNDKKKSRSKTTKKASGKSDKKSSGKKEEKSSKSDKKSSGGKKSSSKKSSDSDDDDEKQDLIDQINEIFEDSEEYDTVTIKELIKSISTSKKNPNGKKKIEELSVKELNALISVLADEDDEDDDEEED